MIIAQISDTHIALDTPDAEQRARDLEAAIADINGLDPLPDAIIHTGDIVQNGRPDEYALVSRILARARAPIYVATGNKDDRGNLRAAFSPWGYLEPGADFINYAIETHPVRLIAVDSKNLNSNKGDFCVERAERLIKLIDAEKTKPIAIFNHHPPFEVMVGPHPLNFETPEMMERLRRTLRHSNRVVAVFSGHVHRGTAGHVADIPASVMPCIATNLRKGEYPASMQSSPVYHLHRFEPACGFITEARVVRSRALAPAETPALAVAE